MWVSTPWKQCAASFRCLRGGVSSAAHPCRVAWWEVQDSVANFFFSLEEFDGQTAVAARGLLQCQTFDLPGDWSRFGSIPGGLVGRAVCSFKWEALRSNF